MSLTKRLRVALLSDLHVKNSPDAIADLAELWSGVIEQTPDIILLGGDYINDGASNQDIAINWARYRKYLSSVR